MITKERMSNASQRVLEILKMNDNLSQKEIIRKSGLTERTVRYVLNMFNENDLLNVGGTKKDRRVKVYSLRQHEFWG
jgi:DNA-binding MarR family transcriptional regulator